MQQKSTQLNSASYPQQEEKELWATGWRPSAADWGGGILVGCKPQVHLFVDADNGWLHTALGYH